MRIVLTPLLLFGCAGFAAPAVEPSASLFENEQVKVVRALEKAHVTGKFHEHKLNRVMVYQQSGRQRFEYQDGREPAVFDWTAGQVKWSPADGMHSPEVLGDTPFNIIEVELKKPGTNQAITSALDPLKIDSRHYHLEFENNQVRVIRVKIGPHEVAPLHQHALNRVTIFLTDQSFRVSTQAGKIELVQHKKGEIAWGEPLTHKEENLSDDPFEAVVVEIKS